MMSLFSWLLGKSAKQAQRKAQSHGSAKGEAGLHSLDAGRTPAGADATAPQAAAHSRNERMERREALYMVVRDAMVRAGVLSASYKFKVLALDPRGQQFLVMMDLAREYAGEAVRLSEIEGLIFQTAKARHNITVTAVYWRINDQIAANIAQKGVAPQGASLPLAAAAAKPHPASASAPAALAAQAAAPTSSWMAPAKASDTPVRLVAPRFDPIEADEVAAFKRALASAAAARVPVASAPGVAVRTGARRNAPQGMDFADTEMPDPESRAQSLSNTQYGDL